jgi:hypothetical protein
MSSNVVFSLKKSAMVGVFREAADPGLGRQVPLRPEADRHRHQRSSSGKILFSVRDCQGRLKSAVRIGEGVNGLHKLRHAYFFIHPPPPPTPQPPTPLIPSLFSLESFLWYFFVTCFVNFLLEERGGKKYTQET